MTAALPELHVLGVSFRTAPVAVREGLAFTPDQAADLLRRAAAELPGVEALVLSTCNRTEVHLAGDSHQVEQWYAVLRAERPHARALDDACVRYHHRGEDAVRHLLRVACGLDSALLGDSQVLGQLRRALSTAQQAGTVGQVLDRALAAALRTGRAARARTAIGKGAPGVGPAVAEALRARSVPRSAPVLVLGAGEAARAVTRAVGKAGYDRLLVSSRRASASEQLAAESGARAVRWEDLPAALGSSAVVVAATAAPTPVLSAPLPVPAGTRVLVVDAGFPRQVDPRLAAGGVEVVSLEALTSAADAAATERQAAVPAVERLVEEQVAQWLAWCDSAPLEHAIKALHAEAAQMTREAADALAAAASLPAEQVERLLRASVRGLLHGHVTRLRSLPGGRAA